ncbi:hypothetical protein H5410_005154, partial [Solanum commersonii]
SVGFVEEKNGGCQKILGNHKNTIILQFKLLLKSLRIRKLFTTLVLKILNKKYACEQELLNKIWNLKMEHMKLITDARADLNKKTNRESKELSIKTGNDKRKKKRRKIEKLVEVTREVEKINKEARGELLKVGQKYNRIRQLVYEKRTNVIKDIPSFWSTAFLKYHVLGELVCTEEDRKIFEFLSSIKVELSRDVKSGYTIIFNFDSNEYFENTKLWKKYVCTKTSALPIQWTQGKGVDEQSFFKQFSEVDKRDEIGEMIKDELWSDPLICFHHEADVENVAVKM